MSFGTVQAEKMTTESGYSLGAGNASSFKNRIINGNMTIAQRTTSAVVSNESGQYPVDRFYVEAYGGGVLTSQQSSTAPDGFNNSTIITVTTTDTSLAATDDYEINQKIEGFNVADLGWGTASAKTITLSFWVRSSVTGSYSVGFQNSAAARSYVGLYTINSANTWEQKTITVAGDTSGTWGTGNGAGFFLRWCLATGSNRIAAAANTWESANRIAIAATANPIMGTSGATWYMTGVQLEVGTVATSFDFRSYTTELQLCQRYCLVWAYDVSPARLFGWNNTTTVGVVNLPIPVTLRSPPTSVTVTNASTMTYYASGVSYTVTAVSLDSSTGINTANLVVTTVGTLSVGAGSILGLQNTGNKIILNGMELS